MRDPEQHPVDCPCADCRVRRHTIAKVEAARKLAAEKARAAPPITAAENSRREQRKLRGQMEIDAEVAVTEQHVADLRKKRELAEADRRAARYLELKKNGLTSEAAFAQIELEFATKETTDDEN